MEEKLLEYRRREKRKEYFRSIKDSAFNFSVKVGSWFRLPEWNIQVGARWKFTADESCTDESLTDDHLVNDNISTNRLFLYVIIWLATYVVFIYIEFGAVYFTLSVLLLIYMNTSTRSRKPGEVSAYSVFNENCKEIHGTLNAQQFEKEIRGGLQWYDIFKFIIQ